jgi:hypothetical protein
MDIKPAILSGLIAAPRGVANRIPLAAQLGLAKPSDDGA